MVMIDLSLGRNGCTATDSTAPPGSRVLAMNSCCNSLRNYSLQLFCCLAAKASLASASHLSLFCTRVCTWQHVVMVALKKDARTGLRAAEVQIHALLSGGGNILSHCSNIHINPSFRCLSLPKMLT